MTPLAYRIAKQRWTPRKHREPFDDEGGLVDRMDDIHCFEVSEVFDLIDDLGSKWHASMITDGRYNHFCPVDRRLAFLPAPKTWIEWRGGPDDQKGYRFGALLEDEVTNEIGLATFADGTPGYMRSFKHQSPFALRLLDADIQLRTHPDSPMTRSWQITFLLRLYATLAMINSPKVIGRRQIMPHRTLVKNWSVGKFPLHAWTEIKLLVNKPPEIDDGAPHEAWLTGRRALHFCRAHVRMRLGVLEYVRSHWRGDPAIGIKRSRYIARKAQAA
jgi:hypothetical protein